MGREFVEEDIVRLFMTWDEVEEHCVRRTEQTLTEKMG